MSDEEDGMKEFLDGLAENVKEIVDAGWDFIIKLLEGITTSIEDHDDEFRGAMLGLAYAMANAFTGGLLEKANEVKNVILGVFSPDVVGSIEDDALNYGRRFGDAVRRGIEQGVNNGGGGSGGGGSGGGGSSGGPHRAQSILTPVFDSDQVKQSTFDAFSDAMIGIGPVIEEMAEFNPTITPVLDLSRVRADASKINGLITPAYGQALSIADEYNARYAEEINGAPRVATVTFEQNNYSPTMLNTTDIYRQTKSQIAMAKEDLRL